MSATGTRHVAVCADDYGMHEAICTAVHELAERGRLSAVSCLVEGPAWRTNVGWLRDAPVDIGLHLNFTERMPGTHLALPLGAMIALTHTRLLDRAWVREAIDAQLDAFESALDRAPDFIDGHQHVHQLPVVRDELLDALAARPGARPWLRSTAGCAVRGQPGLKQRVIQALGYEALARAARVRQVPMSGRLLGVYAFGDARMPYGARVSGWMKVARDADLLMTHPGARPWAGDPLGGARVQEFEFLRSPAFAALLEDQRVSIARLSVLCSSPPGSAARR